MQNPTSKFVRTESDVDHTAASSSASIISKYIKATF